MPHFSHIIVLIHIILSPDSFTFEEIVTAWKDVEVRFEKETGIDLRVGAFNYSPELSAHYISCKSPACALTRPIELLPLVDTRRLNIVIAPPAYIGEAPYLSGGAYKCGYYSGKGVAYVTLNPSRPWHSRVALLHELAHLFCASHDSKAGSLMSPDILPLVQEGVWPRMSRFTKREIRIAKSW